MSTGLQNIPLKVLYEKAKNHEKMVKQWSKLEVWESVVEYHNKLEALVEVLESAHVFNIGDGLDNFKKFTKKKTVIERLNTFGVLYDNHR